MTFQEVDELLPNGLHDAELRRFEMDYVQRKLDFYLDLWIGDMEDPPEGREVYRPVHLIVQNVAFLIIEPPDPMYPWHDPGPITVDAGAGKPPQVSSSHP